MSVLFLFFFYVKFLGWNRTLVWLSICSVTYLFNDNIPAGLLSHHISLYRSIVSYSHGQKLIWYLWMCLASSKSYMVQNGFITLKAISRSYSLPVRFIRLSPTLLWVLLWALHFYLATAFCCEFSFSFSNLVVCFSR